MNNQLFLSYLNSLFVSDCGGITYEPSSKKYTLRQGKIPKTSHNGEISWIKDISNPNPKPNPPNPNPPKPWPRRHGVYLERYCTGKHNYNTLDAALQACVARKGLFQC